MQNKLKIRKEFEGMCAVKVKKGKGILFEAVPDNGQIGVSVGENGSPQLAWPNRVVLPDGVLTKLKKDTAPFLYPPPKPIEYQGASWIVNLCADADEYRNALIGLDDAFGDKLPIFNHPRAVAMTRRDLSTKLLEGIPNLIVPKCVRFKADASNSFQKTFEAEGFKYPVLIRPATSQTGRDLVRIDTPFDWTKVYETQWFGKYHYMTQFVEYADSCGFYKKIRIAFVGGKIFFRSFSSGKDWLIKGFEKDASEGDAQKSLDGFLNTDISILRLGGRIRSLIPLDFFGADIGLSESGDFILFEVNPAMTIAKTGSHGSIRGLYDKIVREISAEIEKHILSRQFTCHDGLRTVRETLGI